MEHKVIFVLAIVLTLALSTLSETLADTCVVQAHQRSNCGYPGVTREECQSKGCCFDDKIVGVPWCYYPAAVEEECEF